MDWRRTTKRRKIALDKDGGAVQEDDGTTAEEVENRPVTLQLRNEQAIVYPQYVVSMWESQGNEVIAF